MAENHKIKVNPKLLQSLQKIIKEELTNNAKKNEWGNEESETTFINALCKNYELTVELALRENVAESNSPSNKVEQEVVDKERAMQVNDMCSKSEDFLRLTIKKRKTYPKMIKEFMKVKHDDEISHLECIVNEKQELVYEDIEMKLDMAGAEEYVQRVTGASEQLSTIANEIFEESERLERFQFAANMNSNVESQKLKDVLFSKRKISTTFDSFLETPKKEIKICDSVKDTGRTTVELWQNDVKSNENKSF
ncbi:uncharacterized protein LOC124441219 isoform X2 [Xenia sp. Carnegie-2017]|uniref:uncharacterized protein LOC124441219 isoform X2 n=1 Tax=Xenia sp. Carnegie-2017 TaxID=2897299 RepID=UPI001F04AC2E|nr:uncharacterized protein LOC124441219 isoform X2 [Xenia sp. Carnegie-2017]